MCYRFVVYRSHGGSSVGLQLNFCTYYPMLLLPYLAEKKFFYVFARDDDVLNFYLFCVKHSFPVIHAHAINVEVEFCAARDIGTHNTFILVTYKILCCFLFHTTIAFLFLQFLVLGDHTIINV